MNQEPHPEEIDFDETKFHRGESAMVHLVTRYHDISAGHRVFGHENKCSALHGHNYRIHFTCASVPGGLDTIGRVIDFGVIKSKLCMWLEDNWDHKMLLWERDPLCRVLRNLEMMDTDGTDQWIEACEQAGASVVPLQFNPTAEEMAAYLLFRVGPMQLFGTGVRLKRVVVEETMKCSAMAEGL